MNHESEEIVPKFERTRSEKKAAKKLRKELRKSLIKGHGDSRPAWIGKFLLWLRKENKIEDGMRHEEAKARAQGSVEAIFTRIAWASWLVIVAVMVSDAILAKGDSRSFVHGSVAAGTVVAGVAVFFLVAIMLDVATYRPRLFAKCEKSPEAFFRSLADMEPVLDSHVDKILDERPDSWRRVKALEEVLLAQSNEFIVPDGLRMEIITRIMQRLAGVLASLALLGYGLSAATNGGLLRSCANLSECGHQQSAVTLPEHFYFSVVAFFNGFSDLELVRDVAGYAYLLVVLVSFVGVIYFFLAEAIASQSEFRANMRAAAESFVLQQSRI